VKRLVLGATGVALLGYGIWRIVENASATQPLHLAEWLLGAVVLHDGVLSMAVLAVGWLLTRTLPGRARAHVQGGLITGGTVTVVAGFLIYRRGKSAPGQALLDQNYGLHLAVILMSIALVTAIAYAVRVVRDGRTTTAANDRPDAHHTSAT
jgi:hypothetical protein